MIGERGNLGVVREFLHDWAYALFLVAITVVWGVFAYSHLA